MKPAMYVVLGICLLMAASLLNSSASSAASLSLSEPLDVHSVEQALNHALVFAERHYNLPGLDRIVWKASVDNHPDLSYATHHVFINKADLFSELQSRFAIDPCHCGFVTDQLTAIVHAPDDPHFSHKVTIIDSEKHVVWSGEIDMDGHVTEYMHYE